MAYTLADFQQNAAPLTKAVISTWREESLVMEKLNWTPTDQLKVQFLRTKALPAPAFLNIGEDFGDAKATFEPIEETIHKMGAKIDIPVEYLKVKSINDPRLTQVQAITRSLALGFNDAFINGRPTSSVKELVGLWYRMINDLDSAQSVLAASGGLDISPDATTLSANQTILLDKVDEMVDQMDGAQCDALFMNDVMRRRLVAALKAVGGLSSTEDAFGRKFPTYGMGGPMILDIGRKYDQSTRIIGNVELAAGTALTGGACTTIYGVRFGEPYLQGYYLSDIMADHVGLLEGRTMDRTVVDWTPGIGMVNPHSVARLYGIIAA